MKVLESSDEFRSNANKHAIQVNGWLKTAQRSARRALRRARRGSSSPYPRPGTHGRPVRQCKKSSGRTTTFISCVIDV
eukprot:3540810-Pleurochrysis_carterae.AAC.2